MKPIIPALLLGAFLSSPAQAASPIVLELFTSQGCSSCPPADALLQKLANDPQVLALSFHVDYWDYLGWRDPFSLPESSQRQRDYAQSLRQSSVYTPELVIDGMQGMVGSDENKVETALAAARQRQKAVNVSMTRDPAQQKLVIDLTTASPLSPANIWLVTFSPQAVTAVRNGENSGRNLTSINNVRAIEKVGQLTDTTKKMEVPIPSTGEHYAVLVQSMNDGEIIGAGKI